MLGDVLCVTSPSITVHRCWEFISYCEDQQGDHAHKYLPSLPHNTCTHHSIKNKKKKKKRYKCITLTTYWRFFLKLVQCKPQGHTFIVVKGEVQSFHKIRTLVDNCRKKKKISKPTHICSLLHPLADLMAEIQLPSVRDERRATQQDLTVAKLISRNFTNTRWEANTCRVTTI